MMMTGAHFIVFIFELENVNKIQLYWAKEIVVFLTFEQTFV